MLWSIIHIADILLWLFLAGSVAYVVIFALFSLLQRRERRRETAAQPSPSTFLVVYPAYREDSVIRQSVATFLQQDYPRDRYQLVVVSDHMQADTNTWLQQQPLTLLQPTFEKSSKAKALQFAIERVESGERCVERGAFSHIVILDADNVVSPDFLSRLDAVCQQGWQAIQCHRTAKNADSDIAALDGLSEEINNTLFRRAHNAVGLSSALIGSGMCFDYTWFKVHVGQLQTAVEDRELESLLMREGFFVRYAEDIYVMDEKVSTPDNFQRQRMRWMNGQIQALVQMLPYLPKAIATLNINYIDKTLQQALIPRSILIVGIAGMALLATCLAIDWSVKWWLLLVVLAVSLLIAIPSQLRKHTLLKPLILLPRLSWRMLSNLLKIDTRNTDFLHTQHGK